MQPLISILIPAYNHEKYVQDAIKSAIAQTYQNIELIIIDDGSKDSTWQKIREMKTECEKRFVRVYFETKTNEGACTTLNKLLAFAQGEFVYFLASDDIIKADAIKKELDFLTNHLDYVLCVGDDEFIDADNNRIGWGYNQETLPLETADFKTFAQKLQYNFSETKFNSDDFGSYQKLVKGNYVPNGYLIRRSAFANFSFTPLAPMDDFYMMLYLAKIGKFKFIDEILYSYRWHGANTASRKKHMRRMSIMTYLHEKHILEQNNDVERLAIFNGETDRCRTKFKIGNFIRYYRHDAIDYKENILEVFGRKFQVKYKNFLED